MSLQITSIETVEASEFCVAYVVITLSGNPTLAEQEAVFAETGCDILVM